MSTTTTNFNIVLPEGSDTFNPLTFNNNAFTLVDSVMKANQDRGITPATHIYLDGVNTISRNIATCDTLIFVASSDYEAGSTVAVDGVTMTFRYSDGSAPRSGAFRINQAVLCHINGTILTLLSASAADIAPLQEAINGLDTRVTALEGVEGGGRFIARGSDIYENIVAATTLAELYDAIPKHVLSYCHFTANDGNTWLNAGMFPQGTSGSGILRIYNAHSDYIYMEYNTGNAMLYSVLNHGAISPRWCIVKISEV